MQDYTGISIMYRIGNGNNFGELGRLSYRDVCIAYAAWLEPALKSQFPGARIDVVIAPNNRWHYSDEIMVDVGKTGHSVEDICEEGQRVANDWEFQNLNGVYVPLPEELRVAPYFYELPSDVIIKVLAGDDPFDTEGSNDAILRVIKQFDPNSELSDMAKIHRQIVEADGALDYLWQVGFHPTTIAPGGVYEPFARTIIDGLDPAEAFTVWEQIQQTMEDRNGTLQKRDKCALRIRALESEWRNENDNLATYDRKVAELTEQVAREAEAGKAKQWAIYHALSEQTKIEEHKEWRKVMYGRIRRTFDALIAANDQRVRISHSGSPVLVDLNGATIVHPGMGLGAGAEYCPIEWFLRQFEEQKITLAA